MSIYNMIHGYNPSVFMILPMLGRKKEEYPRFRDCFVSDDKKNIVVYTRVGGNNRGCGYGEEELYNDPHFIKTYDDDSDNTYGYYEFSVPAKWQKDFDALTNKEFSEVSDEYLEYLVAFHEDTPKISSFFAKTLEERANRKFDKGLEDEKDA